MNFKHTIIKAGVYIPLLVFILFFLSSCVEQQIQIAEIKHYLKNNSTTLHRYGKDSFTIPSALLDEIRDNYKVILTGETHGISINYDLRLAFLYKFYKNLGIKYLLVEHGPSQAGTLNKYLETGDTKLLDSMYEDLKGTYEWTRDSYTFWQKVYAYNNSLSESDKLVCAGIDIEHQPAFAISYLQTLLPAQTPPEKIRTQIQSIASVSGDNTKAFEIGKILFASIESYTNTYQQYLGEKFFEFRLIVKNLDASRRAYGSRSTGKRDSFSKIRDRTMYETFIDFYKKHQQGIYWGHFGSGHILHKNNGNEILFASYLEQDNSPVASQVLSIFFAYLDCTAMIRSNGGYHTAPSTNVKSYFYDLQQTDEPVLFKVKGEDFPDYSRQLVESIQSGSSAEYFDYLLLIKNATPTEPLGGW